MPPAKRKSAAQKKKEAEVTEAKTPETQGASSTSDAPQPSEPQGDTPDAPDERPEADPTQPPEEQEKNQAPPQEQPPEEPTDQETFDASQAEAGAEEPSADRSLSPYQPKRLPLPSAGLDQHAAEAERQAELSAAREEHNRRTGDASRASWG